MEGGHFVPFVLAIHPCATLVELAIANPEHRESFHHFQSSVGLLRSMEYVEEGVWIRSRGGAARAACSPLREVHDEAFIYFVRIVIFPLLDMFFFFMIIGA